MKSVLVSLVVLGLMGGGVVVAQEGAEAVPERGVDEARESGGEAGNVRAADADSASVETVVGDPATGGDDAEEQRVVDPGLSVGERDGGSGGSISFKKWLFSHGPIAGLLRVRYRRVVVEEREKIDAYYSGFDGSIGYGFALMFFRARTGDYWMSIGFPVLLDLVSDAGSQTGSVSTGVTIGFFNNVFAVGLMYDLINVQEGPADTGLFVNPSLANLSIVFSVGTNFGAVAGVSSTASGRSSGDGSSGDGGQSSLAPSNFPFGT